VNAVQAKIIDCPQSSECCPACVGILSGLRRTPVRNPSVSAADHTLRRAAAHRIKYAVMTCSRHANEVRIIFYRGPEHGQMYESNRDLEGVVAEPAALEVDHSTARVKARSDMKSRATMPVLLYRTSMSCRTPGG
jgi:hypothetical protein